MTTLKDLKILYNNLELIDKVNARHDCLVCDLMLHKSN